MGIYNKPGTGNALPQMLKDNICPLCKNKMTPQDLEDYNQSDSFEYKCDRCNPKVIISISGGIATVMDGIVKEFPKKLSLFHQEVKKYDGKVFNILSSYFS